MRREHPLWRGFWLACVYTAALVMLGGVDWLGAYQGRRTALTTALAVLAGAALASLPGMLRRRGKRRVRPAWQRLLNCFLAGAAASLACGMAGTGSIISALFEGSAGAYAFMGTAGLTAFVTARIAGKGARA